MVLVEQDHPRAGREDRQACARSGRQRRGKPLAHSPQGHRRGLSAREHQRSGPRGRRRCEPRARRLQVRRATRPCASKSPWRASTPLGGATTSRGGEQLLFGELARLEARHRAAKALGGRGDALGVGEVRRRLDDRARARAGSSDLKIPEPTKTPSAPSCITSEASAGVAMPPAQNITTGRRPARRPR